MNDLKNFRPVNNKEKKIIENTLLKLSSRLILLIKELDYQFFISLSDIDSNTKFPSIYLAPINLTNVLNVLNSDVKTISSGIYFGFIKKNHFYLSLEGAEFLYIKNCISKRNYVSVNKKGEKSILYGNNIKKELILEISNELCKKDLLLVFNQSNELIAIAQSQVDFNSFQNLNPKDFIAITLVDKGYYLRIKQ